MTDRKRYDYATNEMIAGEMSGHPEQRDPTPLAGRPSFEIPVQMRETDGRIGNSLDAEKSKIANQGRGVENLGGNSEIQPLLDRRVQEQANQSTELYRHYIDAATAVSARHLKLVRLGELLDRHQEVNEILSLMRDLGLMY